MESIPYVDLAENKVGDIRIINGSFGDIFIELSHRLNFSYHATNPPDGEWGALKADGTWSGMVGQLETKIVDIGEEPNIQIN